MCCDDLVCARCARPVAAGGCGTCRATRSRLHGTGTTMPATVLVTGIVALLGLAALLSSVLGR